MNKGLEALKDLQEHGYQRTMVEFFERLEIIEKELKEYKQHEEILNDYGLTLANFREACLLLAMLKGEGRTIHNIDKQLKALEIIKEKNVDIVGIKKLSLEDYNKGVELGDKYKPEKMKEYPYKKLTQEEYDLLKEVLL